MAVDTAGVWGVPTVNAEDLRGASAADAEDLKGAIPNLVGSAADGAYGVSRGRRRPDTPRPQLQQEIGNRRHIAPIGLPNLLEHGNNGYETDLDESGSRLRPVGPPHRSSQGVLSGPDCNYRPRRGRIQLREDDEDVNGSETETCTEEDSQEKSSSKSSEFDES
tara:strand:- start:179 stop:670 length:492 start_codon:yes stop_codon:yes gene_type:complete